MSRLPNDMSTALTGAVQLARFDATGMRYFDTSIAGFWRSFWAAGLVAPFFLLLLILRHMDAGSFGAFSHHIIVESLAYAIAWLVFPVVMLSLSKSLDCRENFVPFIVAYNWCGALQNAVYLPIAILAHAGALSTGVGNFLALVAIVWVVTFTFFVARTALAVPATTAFGIVALDLIIGIVIDAVTNRFL